VDLTDYLRILRSRWLIVFATVIVAVVAAWVTSSVTNVGSPTSSYQARTVLLSTEESTGLTLETVASLAKIEPIAQLVAQKVGYKGEPLDLADSVIVVADESARTLSLTATSQRPREAERLADTWTTELIDYLNARKLETATSRAEAIQEQLDKLINDIASLQQQIADTPDAEDDLLEAQLTAKNSVYGILYQQQQSYLSSGAEPVGLDVVQNATAQPVASTGVFQPPRSRLARVLIGLVLGLALGAGLAILIERVHPPIRTKQAAERSFGYPVIAEVPATLGRLVTADRKSSAAHAFRLLAATLTRLSAMRSESEPPGRVREPGASTILVTSASPSEGKTTVAANLSAALAELGKRVLIMSCDFHRPVIHEYFGVSPVPGLAETLASSNGQRLLAGNVWTSVIEGVSVVPSGQRPENPGELLSSGNMSRALDEARAVADFVILDTAPLFAEGDTAHLLPGVDGVLLVARAGKTTHEIAGRAREFLDRLGAAVIGVVLTGSKESAVPRRYYGYGDYGSESSEARSQPAGTETASGPLSTGNEVRDFPDSHDTRSERRV
jgi:capsular exopolysaccharide synthesis family protein